MPLQSDRASRIAAATKHASAKSEMGKHPILIGGEKKMFEVYRLPIKLLAYNIRNGRFAAELRAKEKQLGRRLDPLLSEDEKIIRDLLLDLDPSATELLKKDLQRVGQTDPGIITHDGFVINGNRRMAILQELHNLDGSGKYERLEVHVLTEGIGEKDLWRIEAGLQLSRDKRLDYGPVNDLLKIREGLKSKLTPTEIAATLYGVKDANEVREKDRRLTLIDSYLEYIGETENYTKANGFVEHFINIQDLLRQLDKEGVKAPERHKWLLVAFEMIRAEMGHVDIRTLRKVAASQAAKTHLLKNIKPKAGKRGGKEEQAARDTTKDQFGIAKDYLQNEDDSKRPGALLDKAKRAIETLLKHRGDVIAQRKLHQEVNLLAEMLTSLAKDCRNGGRKR